MSSALKAWNKTLFWEGGYTDNPADFGNYCNSVSTVIIGTKYGITCSTYRAYYGFNPTKEQMQNLTVSQAGEIAIALWWDKNNLSSIPIQPVADHVFDLLFHFTPKTAGKIIQNSIIATGYTLPVYGLDYKFGSETLAKIIQICNEGQAEAFNYYLVSYRKNHYEQRVNSIPSQATFLSGWINRANDYSIAVVKNSKLPIILLGLGIFGYIAYKYKP